MTERATSRDVAADVAAKPRPPHRHPTAAIKAVDSKDSTMTAAELQAWQARCGFTVEEAADALLLAPRTYKNLIYGTAIITRRTARMTERIEDQQQEKGL